MQNAAILLPAPPEIPRRARRVAFSVPRLPRPAFGRRRAPLPDGSTRSRWRITAQDLRDFLMAYSACVIAVGLFIA